MNGHPGDRARPVLVVNADDAGLHPDTDEAILAAARAGVVRSASVVAGGPTAPAFVTRARELGLGLGLHFDLTQGAPLTGESTTLTGGAAFPAPKERVWAAAARGDLDPGDVAREARAQWDRLVGLGAEPTHLDGHNHIHVFPAVAEGLRRALGGVPLFLRCPEEPECPVAQRPGLPAGALGRAGLAALARGTRWTLAARFAGFRFSRQPWLEVMAHLAVPRPGVTEWMVHPGCRPGSEFTESPDRDREAELLANPATRALLEGWGYRLARFEEAGA